MLWNPLCPPPPSPEIAEDTALVAAYLAGDAGAFDRLYDRYAKRVYGYARALTGSRTDAEDLTQETFLAAVRGFASWNRRSGLLTYLLAIATRRFRDERRRRSRRPVEVAESDSATGTTGGDPVFDTVLMREIIHRLEPERRAAFLCAAYAGLTHAETALVLGKPLGTVKWQIAAATKELRAALTDAPPGDTAPKGLTDVLA